MAEIIYVTCALAAACCTFLLFRAYRRTKVPLLFWSGACFLLLTISNGLIVLDLVIFKSTDLALLRAAATCAATVTLLYGMIRETTS